MARVYPSGVPHTDVKVVPIIVNEFPESIADGKGEGLSIEGTFTHGNGDWLDINATEHYFYLTDGEGKTPSDFDFASFEWRGQQHAGFLISPPDGVTAEFVNEEQTAIRVINACNSHWYRREFKLYVRDKRTGKIYPIGPGGGNGGGTGIP